MAQSKCLKCCPSALTQACSRPCHSLMALSTTRCSRLNHAAIRRCIVCYRATLKLVLDYRKDFRFYQVSKCRDIVNWLTYNHVQNQLNRPTSDEVIVKVKRVTFFLRHSVEKQREYLKVYDFYSANLYKPVQMTLIGNYISHNKAAEVVNSLTDNHWKCNFNQPKICTRP